ncbi:MAG: ComEC/Rec2 family competence protein [Aminobacteriaceae bacterium]
MTVLSAPSEGLARAPLLFLLAGLFSAAALCGKGMPPAAAAAVASLVCAGLLLVSSLYRPARFFPFMAALSLLAFCISLAAGLRMNSFSPVDGSPVSDGGEVVLERPWGYRRALVVEGRSGRYLIRVRPYRAAREGDLVSFSGRAVPFPNFSGSSFNERLYWRARGVDTEVETSDIFIRRMPVCSMASFRTAVRRRILLSLPPRVRGYMLAAVLGVRDPELADGHRVWGTAHLLAVSGFHVGLAALAAWKLVSLACFRRILPSGWRVLPASVLLWAYVLLAGGAPSALRAAVMIQSVFLGKALGRRGNALNAVSLAAVCLLAWRLEWYADTGWRLSVTAALILAAAAERARGWGSALHVAPLVWFTTYPQSAAVFGPVPAAGILLNLVALPVFAFLYPFALALSLPALLGIPGGYLIAGTAEGLFILWEKIAGAVSALVPWSVSWDPWLAAAGGALFVLYLSAGIYPLRGRTVAGAAFAFLAGVLFL